MMNNNLQKATEVFTKGGIVIFPTDTACGIGCRIDFEESVKKLFSIRKRPETKPTPVLCSSYDMAEKYVSEIPDDVLVLMRRFWPGGLTIILPANIQKVPSLVRGGGLTVGLRVPSHKDLLKVIENLGVPILGPSANFSGGKTPYSLAEVDPALLSLADYVFEGECLGQKASTVVDCTQKPWQIVRHGAVEIEQR